MGYHNVIDYRLDEYMPLTVVHFNVVLFSSSLDIHFNVYYPLTTNHSL